MTANDEQILRDYVAGEIADHYTEKYGPDAGQCVHQALTTPPAPLTPEREADRITGLLYEAICAFQQTAHLSSLQHAQMRGYLAEHLAPVVTAELEQQAAAATEYRVPAPHGPGLYVRRNPAGTGWAVFEALGRRGSRAWTRDGWQLLAVLTHPEAHCWPDATTALAEARKALGTEAGESA